MLATRVVKSFLSVNKQKKTKKANKRLFFILNYSCQSSLLIFALTIILAYRNEKKKQFKGPFFAYKYTSPDGKIKTDLR